MIPVESGLFKPSSNDMASSVAAGQFDDPAVLDWLRQAFAAHTKAGGAVPLERCLRLGTQNKQARVARDAWLLRAWHTLTEVPAGRPRSNELARQLRRFETEVWPKWCNLPAPPKSASELRAFLFHAARTGAPLPAPKMVHIICCKRHGNF